MTVLVLGTYNVGHKKNPQVRDDIDKLKTYCDAIFLQEVRDRQEIINETERWDFYQPTHKNQPHNAIIWKKETLAMKHTETIELTPATDVGESGAGGKVLGAHWMHHVTWRHKPSDRQIHGYCIHMVPSVQGSAATPAGRNKRRNLFRRAVDGIVHEIKQTDSGLKFVGGDWNATPDFELLDPLGKVKLVIGYKAPNTLGGRNVDRFYFQKNDVVKVQDNDTYKLSSDHKAAVVTYNLKKKPQ